MLEIEFNFYLAHQAELVKKYNGKHIVIKGSEVIGNYETAEQAYIETSRSHETGTFLIQLCESGDKSYTQTFHSRVAFA